MTTRRILASPYSLPPGVREQLERGVLPITIEDLLRSNVDYAWGRMARRYHITQSGSGFAHLLPWILPITNMDELLQEPQARSAVLDLTIAAGTMVVAFTVPGGERWYLDRVMRDPTAGSSFIQVIGYANDPSTTFALGIGATAGSAELMGGMVLDQGMQIGMRATGNVGDATITFNAFYRRAEAF